MSVYRRELAKARLGDNIANHMGFIFALALYDKFDLTFKQITNYYTKTVNKHVAWQDDDNEDVTSESMMEYCRKRKIDVVGWVKSILMPQNDAGWIPVKYHVITEEEREEGCFSEDIVYYLDCKMPDDDQEIIVTDGKYVWADTCIVDDGFALDSGHDWIEDVIAWMPMPEPYKESEDV